MTSIFAKTLKILRTFGEVGLSGKVKGLSSKMPPSYSEKNWGAAFPRKWFWVQCNVFEGASGEAALTAAGGVRQLPGLTETFENAALLLFSGNLLLEFIMMVFFTSLFHGMGKLLGIFSPWGSWFIAADNETHKVELKAATEDPGTALRAPTIEAGFVPACKDAMVI